MLLVLLPLALANGLSTHVWIATEARPFVVPGALHDFVNDPALEPYLRNGAQFPDGGYAVDSPYGESAHWEPLQGAYLDWIRANFGGPPYEGEAAKHVAFLLGMAAHNISDQTFDSMYMERSYVYDADSDWSYSADEATDVALAAAASPQEVPDLWVPTDALVGLFAAQGVEVDAATMEHGQALTGVALEYVGLCSENPGTVAMYHDRFPWASEHILDADVFGSPPNEARVTAVYWEQLWGRLEGTWTFDQPLMYTFPVPGALGQPTSAADIESRVTFVLTRGLDVGSLLPGAVTVADTSGHVYVPDADLYYGQSSQVINLIPGEDWATEDDFVVTVLPGLTALGGEVTTEPFTFGFSTRTPPADTGDAADSGDPTAPHADCGCANGGARPPGGLVLLALTLGLRRRSGRGDSATVVVPAMRPTR